MHGETQAGGRQANLAALYDRHGAGAFRFLGAQTGDAARARDLCQETFLRLAGPLERGEVPGEALVCRLARNLLVRDWRRGRSHGAAVLASLDDACEEFGAIHAGDLTLTVGPGAPGVDVGQSRIVLQVRDAFGRALTLRLATRGGRTQVVVELAVPAAPRPASRPSTRTRRQSSGVATTRPGSACP